ncbi:MAG TPA: glycoside hydrolase family 30 protein [Kiritimatiellia bacterium]|nr:glycoside hydrolase family 30 protein [Kiritimatiellia bacterium]
MPVHPCVSISPAHRFQTILGFGGAFTESAALTLNRLPPEQRERVLDAYFDPAAGHGYTLCRTHLNSCDFSVGNYACCDAHGDVALDTFSIDRERAHLIPMIRAARERAGIDFKLFASPWSPPAWMKTNGEMNNGGALKPEYRAAWANYYIRFIQALRAEGIPIWGLTVQNEPLATQKWDSCIFTAEDERDFVREHLGPALQRAGLADVNIIVWDHNRDWLVQRLRVIYGDPRAARYIWGAGFHWYAQEKFDNLNLAHDAWPEKHLLFTEGCQEGGPHPGSWELGERYARSMIRDLNRWAVGWVDWNLALDMQGGPNHVGNFCSAPILVDAEAGAFHLQSSYYYIGHFSRFVRPGARRLLCASTRDDLEAAAFLNADGRIACVILNATEQPHVLRVECGAELLHVEAPRRSILTLLREP